MRGGKWKAPADGTPLVCPPPNPQHHPHNSPLPAPTALPWSLGLTLEIQLPSNNCVDQLSHVNQHLSHFANPKLH